MASLMDCSESDYYDTDKESYATSIVNQYKRRRKINCKQKFRNEWLQIKKIQSHCVLCAYAT